MTLITWQNGGPVLRDGKVGTEAACCCDQAECSEDLDCCVCMSDSFYFDGNGNPLDCAGLGAGWQNRDGIVGDCIFIGNESFPCPQGPVGSEEWIARVFWCNQQYPEAAAIDSFEPMPIGHCCSGVCQKSCDEADPP